MTPADATFEKVATDPAGARGAHGSQDEKAKLVLASFFGPLVNHDTLHGVYQFVLCPSQADGDPIEAYVRLSGERADVCGGTLREPDLSIRVGLDELERIVRGEIGLSELFMSGKIVVTGPFSRALQLAAAHAGDSLPARTEAVMRYPALPRASERLAAQQPLLEAIERRDHLSPDEFRRRYLETGTPVVVKAMTRGWPIASMTSTEVRRAMKGLQGYASRYNGPPSPDGSKNELVVRPLEEFLDLSDTPTSGAGELPYYITNNPVPQVLFELMGYPEYFSQDSYMEPTMWLGPAGTVTRTHRDGLDNLFIQVWGKKSFRLASPDQRPLLYTWAFTPAGRFESSDVDPDCPDLDRYPRFAEARLLEVSLGPGDMLFLPEGWYHHVCSVTSSFSVNFWIKDSLRRNDDDLEAAP